MEREEFLNNYIRYSLKQYLNLGINENYLPTLDFNIYFTEILIYIYGKENIVDFYKSYNNTASKSFDKVLLKYNLSKHILDKFYQDVINYYKFYINNKIAEKLINNDYIFFIQEDLIEMFLAKFENLNYSLDEFEKFGEMMLNLYIYNNIQYQCKLKEFINQKNFELEHKLTFVTKKKLLFSYDVYKKMGLNEEKLNKLTSEDLEKINLQILNYYKLSPIDANINMKINKLISNNFNIKKNKERNNLNIKYILVIILGFLTFIFIGVYIGVKIIRK